MQKILIAVNSVFHPGDEIFRKLLSETYGYSEEYLDNYFYEERNCRDYEMKNFRTDPKIHSVILAKEKDSNGNYIIGEEWGEIITCKIIEIPDEIEWNIRDCECSVGEYVCEKYRTWN